MSDKGSSIPKPVFKVKEVLSKTGLLFSEPANLTEVLCKPKLLPLKSMDLQKIQEMEKRARQKTKQPATSEDPNKF